MKAKFLLSLILISSSFTICNAQITKGTVSLGGDLSFYTSTSSTEGNSNDRKQNNIYLAPSIGKAVKDNLIFGVDLEYRHTFDRLENNPAKSQGNNFGAGVFLRRYLTLGKGFYLFAQGTAGISYGIEKVVTYPSGTFKSETKSIGASVTFYPGVAYAISKKFQIEAGFRDLAYIGYGHSKRVITQGSPLNTEKTKTSAFNIGTTAGSFTNFTLGFRVFFPG